MTNLGLKLGGLIASYSCTALMVFKWEKYLWQGFATAKPFCGLSSYLRTLIYRWFYSKGSLYSKRIYGWIVTFFLHQTSSMRLVFGYDSVASASASTLIRFHKCISKDLNNRNAVLISRIRFWKRVALLVMKSRFTHKKCLDSLLISKSFWLLIIYQDIS